MKQAIQLLGAYTANRFDVYMLAGQPRATCRQHIMEALTGKRLPQVKCGVTALRDALYAAGNITGTCPADRESNLRKWCAETVTQD